MAVLTVGQSVTTTDPTLVVENKLAVGAHQFQLVVVDELGTRSDPTTAVVQILAPPPPAPPTPQPAPSVTPIRTINPRSGGRPA